MGHITLKVLETIRITVYNIFVKQNAETPDNEALQMEFMSVKECIGW